MSHGPRLLFAVTCITCPFHTLVIWACLHLGQDITQPLYELSANVLAAIWCALQMDKDAAAQEKHHAQRNTTDRIATNSGETQPR